MERRIVTVVPEQSGWRVEFQQRPHQVLLDAQHAILVACDLARNVYRATGCPTAVKVRMGCGDGVMIGYHG